MEMDASPRRRAPRAGRNQSLREPSLLENDDFRRS